MKLLRPPNRAFVWAACSKELKATPTKSYRNWREKNKTNKNRCAQWNKDAVNQNTVHFKLYPKSLQLNCLCLKHALPCTPGNEHAGCPDSTHTHAHTHTHTLTHTHHIHITDHWKLVHCLTTWSNGSITWQRQNIRLYRLSNTDTLPMWAKQNFIQQLEF